MGQIVEAYLTDRDAVVADPQRLRDAWKALRETFQDLRPDQVTRDLSRQYVALRRQVGRSDGTIRKELSTLGTALKWHDPNSPAVIELPPTPPPRTRHLNRAEYKALQDAARSPHVALFITLSLQTAARASALLELTWSQVDFDKGVIRLSSGEARRKGRATVPMTDVARAALTAAREAAVSPYVIEYAGGRVGSIKKAFARTAAWAGLDGVSPHVLRHTAAVWMAEAGVPMSEIAQYLGHSDSRITERVYARYSPTYLRGAAAALEV